MTNAVKKIVRSYFGKTEINIDGLIELFEKTGNADVALDTLMGTYLQPEIPQEAQINQRLCTFKSFDKWDNSVQYTYIGVRNDHIYIDKGVDRKLITAANHKEFKRPYDDKTVVWAYVPVEENYLHEVTCPLVEWQEGVKNLIKKTTEE